jgi:hypothetical protein
MTTLAATLSIDARGPSALYLITDSRITWGNSTQRWDSGQKTFASRSTPDIFGFCGDAYFPPSILRQVLERIDLGIISLPENNSVHRHAIVTQHLRDSLTTQVNAPLHAFSFFHGFRENASMQSTFRLWETRYSAAAGRWDDREHDLKKGRSTFVHLDGSGKNVVENHQKNWTGSDAEGTSRAVFWTFCDALSSKKDPRSGGAPQLVGLWREGNGKAFGMIWNGQKYISGLVVSGSPRWDAVDWFNAEFERCDGETGQRLVGAQRHPRP